MAFGTGELFGGPTTRGPGLRFVATAILPKRFAAAANDPLLPQLTPVAYDEGTANWKVWSGAGTTGEVQTLTFDATGGTYDLTFDGETTATLTYANAAGDAATILAALNTLSNVNPGDVTVVRGTPAGNVTIFTVTFGGQYAGQDVPQMTSTETLTGGGASLTHGTGTAGSTDVTGGTPDGFISDFDGAQLDATDETLQNVIMEGEIDYRDIPLPTGESQPALDAALKDGMRAKGFLITQLAGAH